MKNILLIGDIVGYGNLGMSVMLPILSKMKFEIFRLPTSLVSNNFSYGQFAVLDTTDYMRKSIDIWNNIDLQIDAVATGYLVSEEQTKLVVDYCNQLKKRGTKIFVDPIMADDGKLYNGSDENTVKYMRKISSVADLMVPNFTEAKFLADMFLDKESVTTFEALDLAKALYEMSGASVVISSMVVDDKNCTLLYDRDTKTMTLSFYDQIPAQFSGTGDVFSSILFGQYMKDVPLADCVKSAMDFVSDMIKKNKDEANPANGIPIELHLDDFTF